MGSVSKSCSTQLDHTAAGEKEGITNRQHTCGQIPHGDCYWFQKMQKSLSSCCMLDNRGVTGCSWHLLDIAKPQEKALLSSQPRCSQGCAPHLDTLLQDTSSPQTWAQTQNWVQQELNFPSAKFQHLEARTLQGFQQRCCSWRTATSPYNRGSYRKIKWLFCSLPMKRIEPQQQREELITMVIAAISRQREWAF